MALKRLREQRIKEEAKRKTEKFSAGKDNPLIDGFTRKQKRILIQYADFKCALAARLSPYCNLNELNIPSCGQLIGGKVPDRHFAADIPSDSGKIALKLMQRYAQPGVRLYYAEATINYPPIINPKDLSAVRKIIADSGLAGVVNQV